MNTIKRICALLICMVMLIGILPLEALAYDVPGLVTYANIVVFVDFADTTHNHKDLNGSHCYSDNPSDTLRFFNGTEDDKRGLKTYLEKITYYYGISVDNIMPQYDGEKITPLKLANNTEYYYGTDMGINDNRIMPEVLNWLKTVDLSEYSLDANNDGNVDNITIVVPYEYGEKTTDFISHYSTWLGNEKLLDKEINSYNVISEYDLYFGHQESSVLIHNFLHIFGVPDLYCQNDAITEPYPVSQWDIMSKSSADVQYPLAYIRSRYLKTFDLTVITKDVEDYKIVSASASTSSTKNNQAIILKTDYSDDEFFVVEYRQKGDANSTEFDKSIPGTGLVVYRVNTAIENETNISGEPFFIYVFREDEDINKSFFSSEAGRSSISNLTYADGTNSGIVISNINPVKSNAVSFDIKFNGPQADFWVKESTHNQTAIGTGCYQDGSDNYIIESTGKALDLYKYSNMIWTRVASFAVDNAQDPRIVKTYDDKFCIAYRTNILGQNYANLVVFDGANWTTIISEKTTDTYAFYAYGVNIFLGYLDQDEMATIFKVKMYNCQTGEITSLGDVNSSGHASNPAICCLSNVVYAFYCSATEENKVKLKEYNLSSGKWTENTSIDFAANTVTVNEFDGELYLLQNGDGKVSEGTVNSYLYKKTNEGWEKVGTNAVTDVSVSNSNISFLNGEPIITYQDADSSSNAIYVKHLEDDVWTTFGTQVATDDATSIYTIPNNDGVRVFYNSLEDSNTVVKYHKIVKEHPHPLTWCEGKEKTSCDDEGVYDFYYCPICMAYFLDEKGTKQVEYMDLVIPKGHDLEFVPAVLPTCTEGGRLEYWKCKHCGGIFFDYKGYMHDDGENLYDVSSRDVSPNGHTWDEGVDAEGDNVLYTCTICGETKTVDKYGEDPDSKTFDVDVDLTYGQTEARSMLQMINDFRTSEEDTWYWNEDNTTKTNLNNLSTLVYDYDLEKVAMQRAAELAVSYGHTRPNDYPWTSAYWYTDIRTGGTGENIAAGYISAKNVFNAWCETDKLYDGQGHRRTMLNKNFTSVGIGHVVYKGIHFWVQEFAYMDSTASKTNANDSLTKCTIEVSKDTVKEYSLSCDDIELFVGDEIDCPRININFYTEATFGYNIDGTIDANWKSSDQSIVEIVDGKLVAKKEGSATLSTNRLDRHTKITVTVTHPHVYDKKVTTSEYLKAAATCSSPATYYYSCYCGDCGTDTFEYGNPLGHSFGSWTRLDDKQHQRVCANDSSHVEKANHNWNDGVVTKSATCTADGVMTYTCSDCGATKTASITKLGHDYVNGKCSRCGVSEQGPIVSNDRLFTSGNSTIRYSGNSRYETSFATANALKSAFGVSKFKTIIVADGNNFADALAGSYLAAKKSAPILMVNAKNGANDTSGAITYIANNLEKGGTIYILGGTNSVSAAAASSYAKYGTVKRIAGDNRYATNLAILKEAGGVSGEDLLICDGSNFADALSCSALGKPLLLVDKYNIGLSAEQKSYVNSAKNIYIIGGTGSVPEQYKNLVGKAVTRVAGADRFETSLAIANKFSGSFAGKSAVIATGANFPDGLSGGPLAYALGAPLILTNNDSWNYNKAKSYVGSKKVVTLGGVNSLSDSTVKTIRSGNIKSITY